MQAYQHPTSSASGAGVERLSLHGSDDGRNHTSARYDTGGGGHEKREANVVLQMGQPGGKADVKNNMPIAIVTTLLFCFPLGLLATYMSWKSWSAEDRGDGPAAVDFSQQSCRLSIAGIATGIALISISMLLAVIVYESG